MKNKTFTLILSCIFAISCLPVLSFAEGNTIELKTANDILKLEKNCRLDSWSQGRTVILKNDIDMSKVKFSSIPTFGGEFDGGGHTISGIDFRESGSEVGFFRYVQTSGNVKNLNIKGKFFPKGSKKLLGGIAGENRGNIIGCSFDGEIKGKSEVGGIVGVNEGTISNCKAYGSICGEHYTGGVAGKNMGIIMLSENNSKVNTTEKTIKFSIEDINFEKIISAENMADITDTGGIAGYSTGVLQSCTNNGNVGYDHVGYNTGGICGRQSGYVSGCRNFATVKGRKDIGGIVGQTEPHTILTYSPEKLENLDGEIDKLQSVVDDITESTRGTKKALSLKLDDLGDSLKNAKNAVGDFAEDTTNSITDEINNAIEEVNDFTTRAAEAVDKTAEALDGVEEVDFKQYIDDLRGAFEGVYKDMETAELDSAIDYLYKATLDLDASLARIDRAMERLKIGFGDEIKRKQALSELVDGVKGLADSYEAISNAIDKIAVENDKLKDNLGNREELKNNIEQIISCLKEIGNSAKNAKDFLGEVALALIKIPSLIGDIDVDMLSKALRDLSVSIDYFGGATENIASSVSKMQDAFDYIKDYASETGDNLKNAGDKAQKITDNIIDDVSDMADSVKKAGDVIRDFANNPEITFDKVSNDFLEEKDILSKSIDEIITAVDGVRNTASLAGDDLTDDMERLTDGIDGIMSCIQESFDEVTDKSTDVEDYFEDVSEYDKKSQTEGKIADCENIGEIFGDVNVGGVCGSMAIEYDFDPEDDITAQGEKSINFMYTTKSVVRNCKNSGAVTARKNYVGGIVGKADLGMIADSTGKGKIKSESGNYIGGIAGFSSSLIRSCYSKCILSGDDYIGGIVGEGKKVLNSLSIVTVEESNEKVGAIAGSATGEFKNNYFAENELGGIDGIEYETKAKGVSYEEIVALSGDKGDFSDIVIVFKVDEKIWKEVRVPYGGEIKESELPDIPKKEGCYSSWDKKDFSNLVMDEIVTAEYNPYITVIESIEQNKGGMPVVIAEGQFSENTKLILTSEKKEVGEIERYKITIENGENDKAIKIHYLSKEGTNSIKVLKDGKFKNVHSDEDGKYLVFSAQGDEIVFSAVGSGKSAMVILVIAVILILAVFILTKRSFKIYLRVVKHKA